MEGLDIPVSFGPASRAAGLTAALILYSNLSVVALAETRLQGIHPMAKTRFQVKGGAFFAKADPSYERDSKKGDGTRISASDLGFDDQATEAFAGLRWRISDRWRLEGQYFRIDESGKRVIDRQIQWGDAEFRVGAYVKSKADTSVGRVFAGYSFLKNARFELGGGIGVHYLRFKARLSGPATIGDEAVIQVNEEADVTGVVPNLGLYVDYAFNERWLVTGRADWFSANVDEFEGRLWRLGAGIVYQPFRHVNFGAGYELLDIDVDIEKSDWNGKMDSDYYGPTVFVGVTF